MSQHSRGIVLQQLRYGDSSLIVKVFTEEHGLVSFMVKGAFGKHSRFKPAFFQPLTLITLESRIKAGRDLQFMTELAVDVPFQSLHQHVQKNAIVIFISELLNKTVVEASPNPPLFEFVHHSLQWLDLQAGKFADFHLYFMVELSRFLGFYPSTQHYVPGTVFDLMDGQFTVPHPSVFHAVDAEISPLFWRLCKLQPDELHTLNIGLDERRQLLNHLITYYRLHLPGFKGMHSHEVLAVVLG